LLVDTITGKSLLNMKQKIAFRN